MATTGVRKPEITLLDISCLLGPKGPSFTRWVREKREPIVDDQRRVVYWAREVEEWLSERDWLKR